MLTLLFTLLAVPPGHAGVPPRRTSAAWCTSLLFTPQAVGQVVDHGTARFYVRALGLSLKKRMDEATPPDPERRTRGRFDRVLDAGRDDYDPEQPHDHMASGVFEAETTTFDAGDADILGRLAAIEEDLDKPDAWRVTVGLARGSDQIRAALRELARGREQVEARLRPIWPAPRRSFFGRFFLDRFLVTRGLSWAVGAATTVAAANFFEPGLVNHLLNVVGGGLTILATLDLVRGVTRFDRDDIERYGHTFQIRSASTMHVDLVEEEILASLHEWRPGFVAYEGFELPLSEDAYAGLRRASTLDEVEPSVVEDMIRRDLSGNVYKGATGSLNVDLMVFADPDTGEPIMVTSLRLGPFRFRDERPRRRRRPRERHDASPALVPGLLAR